MLLFNANVVTYLDFRMSDERIVSLDASASFLSSRKPAVVEGTLHLPLRAFYAIAMIHPLVPQSDTFLNRTYRFVLASSALFRKRKEITIIDSPDSVILRRGIDA